MELTQEQKIKRFKEMGIPVPLQPIDPSLAKPPVKNLDFAAKLEALKNGQKRDIVENFIAKEGSTKEFQAMEISTKNNKRNPNVPNQAQKPAIAPPPLQDFSSNKSGGDFSSYEKSLLGVDESSPYEKSVSKNNFQKPNPRNLTESILPDPDGSHFINDFKNQLRERVEKKTMGISENFTPQNNNSIPDGYSLINEDELKKKIINISSQVAKKVMTTVLTEYEKSKKNTIVESTNIKKAEIVGKNVVKIDGKLFNISPIKQ